MKIKVAVCDDQKDFLSVLSFAIESEFNKYDLPVEVDSFSNIMDLKKRMTDVDYKVLFLDIDMPGMSGIAFGEYLRDNNNDTDIIFVSNREELVFQAFKVKPLFFIRKSAFHKEIKSIVKTIVDRLNSHNKKLIIQSNGDIISVPINNIIYIECFKKIQNIVLEDKSISVKHSMQYFLEQLDHMGFIQPHRSYIVNCKYIDKIEKQNIVLFNGQLIPISKYRMIDVKEKFIQYISPSNLLPKGE